MKTLNKKAFTLVEVMTVVAIIGILAGIVIMNFSGSRDKSIDAQAVQSVRDAAVDFYSCLRSDSSVSPGSGSSATAGSVMCGGNSKWPTLPPGWNIEVVWYNTLSDYYWIRARNGSKVFICDYSPFSGWSETWSGITISGNLTDKCSKVGF